MHRASQLRLYGVRPPDIAKADIDACSPTTLGHRVGISGIGTIATELARCPCDRNVHGYFAGSNTLMSIICERPASIVKRILSPDLRPSSSDGGATG